MFSQIRNISKRIHKDYNSDILDEADDELKEMFKKVSSELLKKNKGNSPLANIIHNYFYGILPSTKYVSGPMSITYLTSEKYNKKVYIFGEAHGYEKGCNDLPRSRSSNVDISTYLQQTFSNTKKFIDFYMEDPMFRSSKIKDAKRFADILANDLRNCLNPKNRDKCVFKTVRTHFVDVRVEEYDGEIYVTGIFEKLILDLKQCYKKRHPDCLSKESGELLEKILSLDSYEELADLALDKGIEEIPRLRKGLLKLNLNTRMVFSVFKDMVSKWYYPSRFNLYDFKYLIYKIFDENTPELDIKDFRLELLKIIKSLTEIRAPVMDLYTITRIFKKFKKSNYFPPEPKYIIYYAGNDHATLMRKFLQELEFREHFRRESNMETSTRCLNMGGITLDFK